MLPGCSGLMPMPRKIAGSEIRTMEEFIVAMSTPSVVLDSASHLYPGWSGWVRETGAAGAVVVMGGPIR
jgi:hypothetical protein